VAIRLDWCGSFESARKMVDKRKRKYHVTFLQYRFVCKW